MQEILSNNVDPNTSLRKQEFYEPENNIVDQTPAERKTAADLWDAQHIKEKTLPSNTDHNKDLWGTPRTEESIRATGLMWTIAKGVLWGHIFTAVVGLALYGITLGFLALIRVQ